MCSLLAEHLNKRYSAASDISSTHIPHTDHFSFPLISISGLRTQVFKLDWVMLSVLLLAIAAAGMYEGIAFLEKKILKWRG